MQVCRQTQAGCNKLKYKQSNTTPCFSEQVGVHICIHLSRQCGHERRPRQTFMSSRRHTHRFPSPQVVMTVACLPAGSRQPFLSHARLMVVKYPDDSTVLLFLSSSVYKKTQLIQLSLLLWLVFNRLLYVSSLSCVCTCSFRSA